MHFTNVCNTENFDAENRYVIIIYYAYHTHFHLFETTTILRMSREYDEKRERIIFTFVLKAKSISLRHVAILIICRKQFSFMNVLRLANGFKNTFPAKVCEIGRYSFNTTNVFS